jgi:hypothetical protein
MLLSTEANQSRNLRKRWYYPLTLWSWGTGMTNKALGRCRPCLTQKTLGFELKNLALVFWPSPLSPLCLHLIAVQNGPDRVLPDFTHGPNTARQDQDSTD